MAWLNKSSDSFLGKLPLALTAVTVAAAALISGCNVGKTDTVAGTTTTTTTTSGASTCMGSYTGNIVPPSHEVRIANRNRQLTETGFAITGNDAVDNSNTTGGGVDGGIYLEGVFAWETNANCQVIKGSAVIFGFDSPISGTVASDKTINIMHSGGPIVGSVDANNKITGQLQEGGGREWVHGVLNGTFVPNGHI